MELTVQRYSDNGDDTLGRFSIDGQFECFTLEDEFRTEKVWGEKRIPSGRYRVVLRTEGTTHEYYSRRFPDMHIGTLHIIGIPGFKYVLIHIGNTDDDTAGCILVGDEVNDNNLGPGHLYKSTQAYTRIYPVIAGHLEAGGEVWIDVRDEDAA